jgi:hypothetical protein
MYFHHEMGNGNTLKDIVMLISSTVMIRSPSCDLGGVISIQVTFKVCTPCYCVIVASVEDVKHSGKVACKFSFEYTV